MVRTAPMTAAVMALAECTVDAGATPERILLTLHGLNTTAL